MSFEYSVFISYRRNKGNRGFLKNFKEIVETEAMDVTNLKNAFFDEDSIRWGVEFDDKIYDSIIKSHFFIPLFNYIYLHEDNDWCARELYYAIEVEKIIRKALDNNDFCYILPIIHKGSINILPNCINNKNAKEIRRIILSIKKNKDNNKTEDFRDFLETNFSKNFDIKNQIEIDLVKLCSSIKKPTDEEIKKWILEQKQIIRKKESLTPPLYTKNE
ncbi:toll/interleukin-1 receptor domain-containing protein [uncultured Dokdonia sp.]|uniref:toll/interleukin-1 receptor domain-containing protein n=1 Tax=uncultured Dokdonia sp. TaxID=575653 RepID=UPI00260445D0|nr:toll/interleukin-1 receptor domain-containing protein [uncultured Dokdonia sp.]